MKQCNTSTSGLAILGGALIGAAAMYLMDPATGRKRRSTIGHTLEDALGTARDKALNAGQSLASMAGQACDSGYDFADDVGDRAYNAVDDGRSAVTGGISSLAGRVSDLGHNVWDRVRHMGSDASDQATSWYDTLASRAKNMSHPARHKLARTIDPDHVRGTGHAVGWSAAGVGALGVGAACMYFFDPKLGNDRRERCMNAIGKGLKQVSSSSQKLGKTVAEQYHKLLGGQEQSQSGSYSMANTPDVTGEELLRRVRIRVGQILTSPTDVQLMADADGAVTIDGRVPDHERDFLLSVVRSIPGVTRINNRLGSNVSSSATGTASLTSPHVSM